MNRFIPRLWIILAATWFAGAIAYLFFGIYITALAATFDSCCFPPHLLDIAGMVGPSLLSRNWVWMFVPPLALLLVGAAVVRYRRKS